MYSGKQPFFLLRRGRRVGGGWGRGSEGLGTSAGGEGIMDIASGASQQG